MDEGRGLLDDFEPLPPSRPTRTRVGWFAANKRKLLIGTAVLVVLGLTIGLIIHFTRRGNTSPAVTSAPDLKAKNAWNPPFTHVTKLEDALVGGDFVLLADGGAPAAWITLERTAQRGSIKFSSETSAKPLTWVDNPTAQDLVYNGLPIMADVILKYDNGHVSALRRTAQGIFQFVDIDAVAGGPSGVHLEEKVWTLARGVV
jgi:hypothetical protein